MSVAGAEPRSPRAERARASIAEALLSLIDEGDLQPTANRIAERAGISLRLIYHHFGDLESLY
jgi:AcrR family transcriptional regulator